MSEPLVQEVYYSSSPKRMGRPYKYCSRCCLYFTGMTDELLRCPYCGSLLKSKNEV